MLCGLFEFELPNKTLFLFVVVEPVTQSWGEAFEHTIWQLKGFQHVCLHVVFLPLPSAISHYKIHDLIMCTIDQWHHLCSVFISS